MSLTTAERGLAEVFSRSMRAASTALSGRELLLMVAIKGRKETRLNVNSGQANPAALNLRYSTALYKNELDKTLPLLSER